MNAAQPAPHEATTLPASLRAALRIMAKRGPVVELVVGANGLPTPKTTTTTTSEEGR
ncbi:hypothetical protein [Streptomyces sp. NPDC051572]|uniref:hypothetical protein n=1 Tax=Streptomyces sp. NPDC051572 TaxID=3155802 RepID=UPI00344E9F33